MSIHDMLLILINHINVYNYTDDNLNVKRNIPQDVTKITPLFKDDVTILLYCVGGPT